MYTDFSDIKEKGISACRQYFLSCTLNKAWIGLVCILPSLAFPLLYLVTSYSCERLRDPYLTQCACCRTSNIQTTKLSNKMSNPNVWTVLISVKIFQCGAVNKSLEVCFSQSVWSRHFYLKCFVFKPPSVTGTIWLLQYGSNPGSREGGRVFQKFGTTSETITHPFCPTLVSLLPFILQKVQRGGWGVIVGTSWNA